MLKHGTYSTYKNHRCRCEPCRGANTGYKRERRQRDEARTYRGAVTPAQRAYLWAFGEVLKAGRDQEALERAKQRTDTMLQPWNVLGGRSCGTSDWMRDLIDDIGA